MDPGAIVVILAGLGAVVAWVIAGIKSYKLGRNAGLMKFFLNLLGSFLGIFLLWLVIVYPTLDCKEFLCGLGEVIIWFFSSLLLFLVWPIVLILYFNKKYGNNQNRKPTQHEDLLDNEMD